MPNGDVGGGVVPSLELDIPGVPEEGTSFGALFQTVGSFFGGLFGGGGKSAGEIEHDRQVAEAARNREADIAQLQERARVGEEEAINELVERFGVAGLPFGVSPISGRMAIPTPEQGGPALITERFRNLPPIPDVLDFTEGFLGFEGIDAMPVDAPLLSSFLPAVRSVTAPTIQGVLGGLAGGFVSEFLRAPQELGTAQVPARLPTAQLTGCPTEKPHTRILRFIKQNTGVSIKLSRAKSLIRELGLENAARCLGVSAMEACSLLIVASPRRRRGISASDIRIVKRTARRFETLKHDLGHMAGRSTPHHRRRRHTHRHAHQ